MDKESAWYLFENTGNIEAYMLYRELAQKPPIAGAGRPRAGGGAARKNTHPAGNSGFPPQMF